MSATIGDEIRKITERYEAKLAEARARLATARNEALEEAAKVAIRRRKEAMKSSHPESPIREDEAEEICVLIRALKTETPS